MFDLPGTIFAGFDSILVGVLVLLVLWLLFRRRVPKGAVIYDKVIARHRSDSAP